jgi:uncharacterized protein YdeI (YjbR/CyaY-like superfamily)
VLHLAAAETEGGEVRVTGVQLGDDLGAVVIAAGFAGREEDARVGVGCDGISVDFSGGDCMAGTVAKRFRAVLEPLGDELRWVVARVPFDVKTAWKTMVRLRVKVEIGGEVFRTSLFADSGRGGHFVLVNKAMQKAAGAGPGAMVEFAIAPDLEEREAVMPLELAKIFKGEKRLAKWFEGLGVARRYQIGKWICGVKSVEARRRRAEQIAEWLMLAMEGEKELPPVLEVAFRRVPAARVGWEAMTAAQRRAHLLGVFHYRGVEARGKRVAKVVEDAVRVARG